VRVIADVREHEMAGPKKFRLSKDQIKPLARGYGGCIATDMITVEGYPVRFMYREEPRDDQDSGWCFFSGLESDDYVNDPKNSEIYEVNTIANYDPSIIPHLDALPGTAFEKPNGMDAFVVVEGWAPPQGE
jgi:hypothetical protein